jgi:hypothetical protein
VAKVTETLVAAVAVDVAELVLTELVLAAVVKVAWVINGLTVFSMLAAAVAVYTTVAQSLRVVMAAVDEELQTQAVQTLEQLILAAVVAVQVT